jgi:hypothetical protein
MSKTPAAVGAEDRAALVTRAKGGMATYVQGSNGDAVYTNARAMMGRVEAGYFLMIPKTIDDLARHLWERHGLHRGLLWLGMTSGTGACR